MNLPRALVAGAVGTAAMTMLLFLAPTMGMPDMPIGEMLGAFLGIGPALGWAMHGVIGLTLAVIYAAIARGRLPGSPLLQGAIYGFLVFLVAQGVVTPVMGGGFFSGGNVPMIMGSLLGHLVYGGVVGAVYRGAPAMVTAA